MPRLQEYVLLLVALCLPDARSANITGTVDSGRLRGLTSDHRLSEDFILVMNFRGGQHAEKVKTFLEDMRAKHPASQHVDSYVIGDFVALRMKLPEPEAEMVSEYPAVRFMQANMRIKTSQEDLACAEERTGSDLWGLSRVSERQVNNYKGATYRYLQDDGEGVVAYIVDTGVLTSHAEFQGRAVHGFTAHSVLASGESDADLHGHGTHVAGTVAGATYGLAKKAQIVAVKVLNANGAGSTADIIEGVEYVYNDFKARKETNSQTKVVVNMSLGGAPFAVGAADEAAIASAVQAGIPFVVAAGNDAFDACFSSPARISAAVTVGASDSRDTMSSFSNYGPCVDILAPGENILSSYIGASNTAAAVYSGTSMAAPHVTGIVARYLSQQVQRPTPASVKAWLQDVATSGALDLGRNLATPNSLLFMACTAGETYASDPREFTYSGRHSSYSIFDLDSDDRWVITFVSLMVLLLTGLLTLVTSCCACSHARSAARLTKTVGSGYVSYVGETQPLPNEYGHPPATAPNENSRLLPGYH